MERLNIGSGDSSGYGSGSGSGYGSGSGSGDGDGSGYGDGPGELVEHYWKLAMSSFTALWSEENKQRLQSSKGLIAYWKSNSKGMPANGGTGSTVSEGMIQVENGPLNLCHRGTLHATLIPPQWKGDRLWLVAMLGKTERDGEKIGGLKRLIIGECLPPLRVK